MCVFVFVCVCVCVFIYVCVDLLDTPKAISRVIMIPEPSSGNTKTDLRFNQPSSAQAVITTIHSQPENNTKPSTTSFTSRSSALTHAQVVAKLSVLKTPSETDLDLAETEKIRHRSKNTTSNNSQNVSLARAKAMCVRTGSTDWGVSVYITHSHVVCMYTPIKAA